MIITSDIYTTKVDVGFELSGVLIKKTKFQTSNSSNGMIYIIKTRNEEYIQVWGNASLDRGMENIDIGRNVFIRMFKQNINYKNGRPYNMFCVRAMM